MQQLWYSLWSEHLPASSVRVCDCCTYGAANVMSYDCCTYGDVKCQGVWLLYLWGCKMSVRASAVPMGVWNVMAYECCTYARVCDCCTYGVVKFGGVLWSVRAAPMGAWRTMVWMLIAERTRRKWWCGICSVSPVLLHMFHLALSSVSYLSLCFSFSCEVIWLAANKHLLRNACLEKLMVKHWAKKFLSSI
jgi:hypothetical protein